VKKAEARQLPRIGGDEGSRYVSERGVGSGSCISASGSEMLALTRAARVIVRRIVGVLIDVYGSDFSALNCMLEETL
jgi:hypothetical protein